MKIRLLLLIFVLLPALAAAGEMTASVAATGGTAATGNKGSTWTMNEGDDLVKKHCTGCHSEGRIMTTLQSLHGRQDVNYEKELKNIVIRKIRMTNGDISRQDGRIIMDYLVAVWQRQKPGTRQSLPVS